MEVSEAGCCDDENFTGKVVIYVSILSHGLRLPFCHPLRDILDLLSLAPAQLHFFAMRTYLYACIVFCMALEPLGYPSYPDLIALEFLAFYNVRVATKENVTNKKDKG